jgi:enterochelin esterase-like enzyme
MGWSDDLCGLTTIAAKTLGRMRRNRIAVWVVGAILILVAISVGAIGVYRYLDNYWLYRGYPKPQDPAFVVRRGTIQQFEVKSPALGGRSQPVQVYLPPGYPTHPRTRYPVFYLLHGFPGRPEAFFQTVRLAVLEDTLLTEHQIRPMILVAPFGSTGTFTDKEWADGVRPHEEWATFVARDLVGAVDRRFRTIPAGWARALGGLSEGGYGALNIGFQHPGEFRVLESWSGYGLAADISSIFGKSKALLRENSPLLTLPGVAPALRAARTFVWFYSGSTDKLLPQNERLIRLMREFHVPSRFSVLRGGHDWSLWRGHAALALIAASVHLGRSA